MRQPNWDDLRVFLEVARAGGLSAAGPALRMDPATVGRRIARLERDLGTPLFLRSPQGYALTQSGERMLEGVRLAEAAVSRAGEDARGTEEGLTGQVRIGAPDGCANFLLPQVCAEIGAANPGLEIQILSLPRVVNLSRREADMAITVSPPAADRLEVTRITDYRLHLAMRADAEPVESLADLRERPLVGYIPDMIFDKELDYLGPLGPRAVELASNSVAVQLQMIRRAGVGIVHDFALPFAPELRRVLTRELSLTRAFHLVRHRVDQSSDRLNRIAAALREGVAKEVRRLEDEVAAREATPPAR